MHRMKLAKENDMLKVKEVADAHALKQAASMSRLRNDENEAENRRRLKLISEKKGLFQSQEALNFAYTRGLEQGGVGRRALGMNQNKTNFDLRRLQIEQGRVEEIDE